MKELAFFMALLFALWVFSNPEEAHDKWAKLTGTGCTNVGQ